MKYKHSRRNNIRVNKSQNKKNRKISGGKPLFRSIDQISRTATQTLKHVFGFTKQPEGEIFPRNITKIRLVADGALYSYFYKINIENNNSFININIDNNPVNTPVNVLGAKLCIISPDNEAYYLNNEKKTTTVESFHHECINQYNVFSTSYLLGANSITPGIVYTEITSNANSILSLINMLKLAQKGKSVKTINSIKTIISVITENPTWKLGVVLMEYVINSVTIQEAFDRSNHNITRQLCLRNMYRWALLRSAYKSQILHRDFHMDNALYSESYSPGFFHDVNLNPIHETIQIIDWGRTMESPGLIEDIKTLFHNLQSHIKHNPEQFVRSFAESHIKARSDPAIVQFNERITLIFNRWLHIAGFTDLDAYNWVVDGSPNQIINSHIIMFYESRYLFGRPLVKSNSFSSIIRAPDQKILDNINNLLLQ